MTMVPQVPQAGQQAQLAAEQAPDPGQQTSWGAMAPGPPQVPHVDPPASSPTNAARTQTPGSKAFKIIDPKTMQSIGGPAANEGHDVVSPGAVPPTAQHQGQPQQPQQQLQQA